jgi:hypothetical protein
MSAYCLLSQRSGRQSLFYRSLEPIDVGDKIHPCPQKLMPKTMLRQKRETWQEWKECGVLRSSENSHAFIIRLLRKAGDQREEAGVSLGHDVFEAWSSVWGEAGTEART